MKKLLIALFLLASAPAFAQDAQREFVTFIEFYRGEMQRTGFVPDHTSTRDSRVLFLQQVVQRYCHPYWMMKRADPGRQISDEAVVWIKPGAEYRKFGDFIISGGASGWSLGSHLDGILPADQLLVSPLMPLPQAAGTLGHIKEPLPAGASHTVPGCQPQTPAPVPTPQPPAPTYPGYPQNEGVLDATGAALFADFAEAGQGPNPQMFRFAFRVAYDWLVGNVPSLEAAEAKHRPEWRGLLGLPPRP